MSKKLSIILISMGCVFILVAGGLFTYNAVMDRLAGQRAQSLLEEIMLFDWTEYTFEDTAPFEFTPYIAGADPEGNPSLTTEHSRRLLTLHQSDWDYPAEEPAPGADARPARPIATLGILNIPALRVTLPIISELTSANLNISAARFSGTVTDRPERLVIAGHNFRTHFAGLATLSIGDRATFTTHGGDTFYYEVVSIFSVHMSETAYVLSGDYWDITLFTCMRDRTMRTVVRLREVSH